MNSHSEIIDLASEGYFYPSDSVLSQGKVSLFPITAQQEEILANQNLAKRGLVENMFLNDVVQEGFDPHIFLQCDKESILLNLRIANYGAYSKLNIKCDSCEKDYEDDVSFAFRSKMFNFSNYTRGINKLHYVFSKSKKNIYYKLATCKEHDIYVKDGWLAFAKTITISIDGVNDISYFYDYELSATESTQFRKHYFNNTPGYINDITLTCPHCNYVKKSKMDVNHEIMGIRTESKQTIHNEIFDLCYYSNGAFTQEGVYKMPVSLRTFYIKKLIETKNAENEANKAASEGKGKGTQIARPPTVKK